MPKGFNQKHAGCRETSGVFCCERGAGLWVQGSGGGFAANIYGAMPEGLLIAGFPRIVSLPLEGEGAPKGRIGHWRYEREWENASQVDDLRKHPIHR